MSRPVLGIDLGATNSVVASIDDQGQVVILRNAPSSQRWRRRSRAWQRASTPKSRHEGP